MKVFSYLILTALLLAACGRSSQGQGQSPDSAEDLAWLTGKWMAHGLEYYETWSIINDSTLMAVVENDEDGITEKVLLTFENGNWVYSPTYLSAQKGQAISFIAVEANDELIQFENRQNDFPNRIVYFNTSGDQIDVKLEQLNGDEIVQSYDILMSRLE